MHVNDGETKQYSPLVVFFFFFFFFFLSSWSPLLTAAGPKMQQLNRPTLGKDCSLELSTLKTQGNAVKQTACRWSWQYRRTRLQSCSTVGLRLPSYANSSRLPTKIPWDCCPG